MTIGGSFVSGGVLPATAQAPARQTRFARPAFAGAVLQDAPAQGGAANGVPAGAGPEALAQQRAYADMMNDRLSAECQTCKSRKYQDGSNDAGVSFQTPTHIDPGASAAMVSSHEQEHVMRERANAASQGGEVVMQTVMLHGAICPECGRPYIAGGTTRTVTRSGGQQNPYQAAMARREGAQNGAALNAVA